MDGGRGAAWSLGWLELPLSGSDLVWMEFWEGSAAQEGSVRLCALRRLAAQPPDVAACRVRRRLVRIVPLGCPRIMSSPAPTAVPPFWEGSTGSLSGLNQGEAVTKGRGVSLVQNRVPREGGPAQQQNLSSFRGSHFWRLWAPTSSRQLHVFIRSSPHSVAPPAQPGPACSSVCSRVSRLNRHHQHHTASCCGREMPRQHICQRVAVQEGSGRGCRVQACLFTSLPYRGPPIPNFCWRQS